MWPACSARRRRFEAQVAAHRAHHTRGMNMEWRALGLIVGLAALAGALLYAPFFIWFRMRAADLRARAKLQPFSTQHLDGAFYSWAWLCFLRDLPQAPWHLQAGWAPKSKHRLAQSATGFACGWPFRSSNGHCGELVCRLCACPPVPALLHLPIPQHQPLAQQFRPSSEK